MFSGLPRYLNYGYPINRADPLNRGLVLWWVAMPKLPGFRGANVRDLVQRNNATFSGATWGVNQNRIGGFGSVDLGGGTQRAESSTATGLPLGATAAWTMAYWHYSRSYVDLAVDFGWGGSYGTNSAGAQRKSMQFNNNYYWWGAGADWDTGIAFITSAWTHVVYSTNGTNIYLWLNGVPKANTTLPSLATAETYVKWGDKHPAGASPNSLVDDARVYDRVFTDRDALALFQASRLGYANQLNWYSRTAMMDAAAVAGRTTRNTRSHPLGVRSGIGFSVGGR